MEHGFCPRCGGSVVLFVDVEKMVGGVGGMVCVNVSFFFWGWGRGVGEMEGWGAGSKEDGDWGWGMGDEG